MHSLNFEGEWKPVLCFRDTNAWIRRGEVYIQAFDGEDWTLRVVVGEDEWDVPTNLDARLRKKAHSVYGKVWFFSNLWSRVATLHRIYTRL